MDKIDLPIAVFDSGVGGISVLRELVRQLPTEDFLYFGDSANAPYGDKNTRTVRELTLRAFAQLEEIGFKAIVVACNTATSAAIRALRERYSDLPVIGIEPALKPAVDRHPGGRVLVMATHTTLREEKFAALMARCSDRCDIRSLPCPGLMEYVERGELDSPALEQTLHSLLDTQTDKLPDAVVLGCTHYPFLRPVLRRILGETPELIDGSAGTARETARQLRAYGLCREQGAGSVTFRNSLPDERMRETAAYLFALPEEWESL